MFVLYLVKLATTFTAYNTESSIWDTALHYLRPVATEYTPDLNPVDYELMKSGASPGAYLPQAHTRRR